jgi:hypothetical protein
MGEAERRPTRGPRRSMLICASLATVAAQACYAGHDATDADVASDAGADVASDAGVDATGPDTGPDVAAAAAFLGEFERARCDLALRCGNEAHLPRAAPLFLDVVQTECNSASPFRRPRFLPTTTDLVACGVLRFDPSRAEACLSAVATAVCHDDFNSAPWVALCTGAFQAADGRCGSWAGCGEGATCEFSGSCRSTDCPGTCVAEHPDGSACVASGQWSWNANNCEPNRTCNGVCQPRSAPGARCDDDRDCMPPSSCSGYLCGAAAAVGEACYGLVRPPTSYAYCDGATKCVGETCEPMAAAGDACPAVCAPGAVCRNGMCSPVVGHGHACGADAECAPGLACLSGQCRDGRRIGETCATSYGCAEGACVSGVCQYAAAGAVCTDSTRLPMLEVCEWWACDTLLGCVSLPGDGEPCYATSLCRTDSYCDGDGVCRPLPYPQCP